jgi:DNA-binding transcriptional MocR family regulator
MGGARPRRYGSQIVLEHATPSKSDLGERIWRGETSEKLSRSDFEQGYKVVEDDYRREIRCLPTSPNALHYSARRGSVLYVDALSARSRVGTVLRILS